MEPPRGTERPRPYPSLTDDASADVVVIGGGLTGILTAHELSQAGKSVLVLEQDVIGGGATARTTAFLTQSVDTGLEDLVRMYGEDGARRVWRSGADAIRRIRDIAERFSIPCDFQRCAGRVYARNERELRVLRTEAAVAQRLGFTTHIRSDDALRFPNAGYMELPDQAMFRPSPFLHVLAAELTRRGVRIHEHTTAAALSGDGPVRVTTASGATVSAADAVVATYRPFNDPGPTHFKKGIYRSYVLEARMGGTAIPAGIYWNLNRPYDYFRVDLCGDGARIVIGGADHRRELPVSTRASYAAVERTLRTIVGPSYRIIRRWHGPIIESSDGIPLIGRYAPHRYVATAYSGNGMTYAMTAAGIFRDALTGQENPYAALYDPARRLRLRRLLIKGRDYLQEFLGGAFKRWTLR
jgi:glycine/D-amino acid oxidase-like deaminating enzyme